VHQAVAGVATAGHISGMGSGLFFRRGIVAMMRGRGYCLVYFIPLPLLKRRRPYPSRVECQQTQQKGEKPLENHSCMLHRVFNECQWQIVGALVMDLFFPYINKFFLFAVIFLS
jgi:hypothetical protein